MKIKAIKVKCKDLKPGDLFSTAGSEYWDNLNPLSVGERVFIRTEISGPEGELEDDIYRIEIER